MLLSAGAALSRDAGSGATAGGRDHAAQGCRAGSLQRRVGRAAAPWEAVGGAAGGGGRAESAGCGGAATEACAGEGGTKAHALPLSLVCKREMPRQEIGGGRSARGKNGVQAERAVMVEGDGRPGKAGPLKPARDTSAT